MLLLPATLIFCSATECHQQTMLNPLAETQPNLTKPYQTERNPAFWTHAQPYIIWLWMLAFFRVESEQVDSPLTPSPLSENSVEVCGHILAKTFLHQLKLNDVGVYRV